MTPTPRLSLARARALAEALAADLAGGCERLTIAGAVRRRCPDVGDLELVAVPAPRHNLFGEPTYGTLLDPILERLEEQGELTRLKGGPRYQQYDVATEAGPVRLDLFLATPRNFGLILLLRTGPLEYSKRFVTPRSRGGWLPDDLRVFDGQMWQGGAAVDTPEEVDCFRLAGVAWREPWERT